MRSGQPTGGPKVLLVEQDPMTREALAVALEGLGYRVLTDPGGLGVERVARVFRPDVALIDLRAADGIDGAALARRLRAQSDLPLMFLAAATEVDDVLAAVEAAGGDYLVKPFMVSELVARMHTVLRRSTRGGETVLRIGDLELDLEGHRVARRGANVELTRREFALLALLGRRPGVVVSKTRLMADVWGDAEQHEVNLVEVHMSALRRKLEASGPRLIHTVRGAGYVLRPQSVPEGAS